MEWEPRHNLHVRWLDLVSEIACIYNLQDLVSGTDYTCTLEKNVKARFLQPAIISTRCMYGHFFVTVFSRLVWEAIITLAQGL